MPVFDFRGENRRSGYLNVFRSKRAAHFPFVWEKLSPTVDQDTLVSLMLRSDKVRQRKKRETDDEHLTSILDDLEEELSETEVFEIRLEYT